MITVPVLFYSNKTGFNSCRPYSMPLPSSLPPMPRYHFIFDRVCKANVYITSAYTHQQPSGRRFATSVSFRTTDDENLFCL